MENFNHEQFSRYEMCRRSKFSKSVMKKFIRSITDVMINDKTAIALAGITKVYVGELIETGKSVMMMMMINQSIHVYYYKSSRLSTKNW